MKKFYPCIYAFACIFASFTSKAQVSGTVFRDYNGNGIKDNTPLINEPFEKGITVRAFDHHNDEYCSSKTTDANGYYSFSASDIPAGKAVRIEFSGVGVSDNTGFAGAGNSSNIQFITTPSTTVNFAVSNKADYWNNTANPNPTFLVVTAQRGAAAGGYLAAKPTIIQSTTALTGPYNPADADVPATGTMITVAQQQQTGGLFGLAMQKKQQRYFAAASLRRSVGVGPRGFGALYLLDKSGANFSLTGSFTLQGVVPSNGGAALDFGTVTRNTTTPSDDNYFSNDESIQSRDIDAFAKACTISYGDIEADPGSDKLYTINLFQKRLIVFNASAATATLNGAVAASLTPFTEAYDIASLPGCPGASGGAGNSIRPYAVKIYNNKGYVGVVSDAMGSQNKSHLKGYILQFDPNNIAAGFTTVVTITFNNYAGKYWRPWVTTWAQAGGTATTGNTQYPQPVISAIEFNENGSMDIAIKDRWGDQGGNWEFNPVSGATGATQTVIAGDLLHACYNGTGWALEGTAGSCDQPAANTNSPATNNSFGEGSSYGNNNKEWYADISGDGSPESQSGGLTKLMGSNQILSTVYDPMGQGETYGVNYWTNHGIQYNDVTTGVKTQVARMIIQSETTLEKSNAMGDIEFFTEDAPLQVGNRIWKDVNYNGIQDANETAPGVAAGTTVTLRSPGIDGIYGNGDDQTWTTTTNATGNYYFDYSNMPITDNRKPIIWKAVKGILPGYNYRIEVPIPSGNAIGLMNQGSNDNIDNDATQIGTNAVLFFNASGNNHNFDIGIVGGVLPVQRFEAAAAVRDNEVAVSWVTENEINTARFYIERSTDNILFKATGNIAAAGNATNARNYSFNDDISAVSGNGTIYYRIQLVDNDGKIIYSNTVAVKITAVSKVSVWPNPYTERCTVSFISDAAKNIQLRLMDISGKLILHNRYKVKKGPNQIDIANLQSIAPGMYILYVNDEFGNLQFEQKLLKK